EHHHRRRVGDRGFHGKRLYTARSTLRFRFPSNHHSRREPMDAVLQDLRYAARSLRRQPAFALLAIGTLALGIGANAAIFSVVNAVLLRPLGYSHPERIVAVNNLWRKSGVSASVSAPDFHDWHDTTTSFDAMAYYAGGETSVSTGGEADLRRGDPGHPRLFPGLRRRRRTGTCDRA